MVMALSGMACIHPQPISVTLHRDGLNVEVNGDREAVQSLVADSPALDATQDFSGGINPAIAAAIQKNPNATVIYSPDRGVTYIPEGGQEAAAKYRGIIHNDSNKNIFVDIASATNPGVKRSFYLRANQSISAVLFPGRYNYTIGWNNPQGKRVLLLPPSSLIIDAFTQNATSPDNGEPLPWTLSYVETPVPR